MKKIGWITCNKSKLGFYFPTKEEPNLIPTEPPFTPDDQLAVEALRSKGFEVCAVEWGCDLKSLSTFDLLVMRSPWDYMDTTDDRENFLNWIQDLEQAAIPVENPAGLMRWLLHKSYLKAFEAVGVPIVPSTFLSKDEHADQVLKPFIENEEPIVLKPCISASGKGLFYIRDKKDFMEQRDAIESAFKQNDYILQPFLPDIKTAGEWSLIYIDGEYSHAVHKLPGQSSILVQSEYGGTARAKEPPEDIVSFGGRVIQSLPEAFFKAVGQTLQTLLYVRVDIIPTQSGCFLAECEGVEPQLYFRQKPGSDMKFAEALLARA